MKKQENERITYKRSFVAFLDVLGFKNLVQKNNSQNRDKLNKYFAILNSVIKYIRSINAKKDIGFIVISDSVIMSIQQGFTPEQKKESLRNLCIAVGLIQKQLALIDIWLRGGISSGDAYFSKEKNQIVGPAYINAFLLEETMAIYPRVLLDTKIIKELNYSSASELIDDMNMDDDGGLSFENWGSVILYRWYHPDGKPVIHLQQDVALFIDYLSPLVEDNGDDLLTIIKNIEHNIYSDTRTYSKYRWVSDYLKSITTREEKNDNLINSESQYKLFNL